MSFQETPCINHFSIAGTKFSTFTTKKRDLIGLWLQRAHSMVRWFKTEIQSEGTWQGKGVQPWPQGSREGRAPERKGPEIGYRLDGQASVTTQTPPELCFTDPLSSNPAIQVDSPLQHHTLKHLIEIQCLYF